MVTIEELCKKLAQTHDAKRRAAVLEAAAARPEASDFLLEMARKAAATASPEALAPADLAIAIARHREDLRAEGMAWRVRAQALRALGRHAEALAAFDAATDCAAKLGDASLAAQVQIGRIDSLGWLGRFQEAIAVGHCLIEELSAYGAEAEVAKVLVNIGNLYFRRDHYAEALECYERAQQVFARIGDSLTQARGLANCANVLTHLNRTEEAQALYEQARVVFAANGLISAVAMVDANIGFLRYVSGEYASALSLLLRARQEFAMGSGQELEMAKCDLDLADVYRTLNLYPEAIENYERAIRVFAQIPVEYERARAELGRAAILMALARPDEAFVALERAESIFRAQKNPLQRAHVRLVRAYLLRSVGQITEACVEANAAARTLSRHRLHGWAAEARFLLADVSLEAGRGAGRRLQAIARTARRHGRGWLECRAEHRLGRYHLRKTGKQRALRHFRAGVAALEQARTLIGPEEIHVAFLQDKLAVYEDLVSTLLERARPSDLTEALEYVERAKSRLLLERVQNALADHPLTPEQQTQPTREKLASLRAELSRAYHHVHTFEDREQRRLHIDTDAQALLPLEQAYRAVLREIDLADFTSHPDLAGLTSVVSEDRIRTTLLPSESLLEFYIARGTICAFIVTREGIRAQAPIAPIEEVLHAARRLRYHLFKLGMTDDYVRRHQDQLHAGIQRVLRQLYDLLLRPLEPLLAGEQIVLVPHGALHGLPFHAFYSGSEYALDRWEILYAPSAALWYAGIQRKREQKPAGDGLTALLMGVTEPGIERVSLEIEHLARLLPATEVYTGKNATVSTFLARAGAHRRIHLATHALFRADNPLFSGLRFADGWLLARDLYDLRLDCDLATLSACNTGVAFVEPGDELFGLLRGFLSAGVCSLAASLWPADDKATACLMQHFYAHLADGVSKARALRVAQWEVRKRYPHPYHWAAFALLGER